MTNLGFELCREAHTQNAEQWNWLPARSSERTPNRNGGRRFEPVSITEATDSPAATPQRDPERATSSSRMRDYLGSSGASLSSFRYNHDIEDESTAPSHFSDDTGLSSGTTYSEHRKRKRKCALRMMGVYLCLASSVFLGVLLWRMGLIFKDVDESLSAVRDYTNTDGFDESGRMICNGLTLNCHRRANEIMYATVHNAMSSRDNSFLAYNNLYALEDALMSGFRGLTIDSCDCARIGIQLCHGVCIAGFRRPVATFTAIVEFMQQNSHEVVIIEIEVGEESLGPLFGELEEVPGLFDLMYHHPGKDEKWPTLKDMIEMDKRLIIFAHDDLSCEGGECPSGVLPTYDFAFETPFSQRGASTLMDVEETCSVSRGWSDSDFVISNHFATNEQGLPDINVAAVTNAALNLQTRLDACQDKFSTKYGQDVINLLVVDFWNVGDTLDVVHKYNSALPARTYAPSDSPSLAPTLTSQPTITKPPSNADVPVANVLLTPAPTTIKPTPTELPILETPTTSKPTSAPTKGTLAPSSNPSLPLESLFDSILYDPQPTSSAPAIELPSNFTASTTNITSDSTTPSFGDNAFATASPTFASTEESTTPSPTPASTTSATTLPTLESTFTTPPSTLGQNTFVTLPPTFTGDEAPTQAPTLGQSASTTLPPTFSWDESPTQAPTLGQSVSTTLPPTFTGTESPTQSPTLGQSVSTTLPPTTFAGDAAPTQSPTVGSTEEEQFQPEVEKEHPDSLLSSAFGDETPEPTIEDSIVPTREEEADDSSHHVFAFEKDPSP